MVRGFYPINFNCLLDFSQGIENSKFLSFKAYAKIKEKCKFVLLLE